MSVVASYALAVESAEIRYGNVAAVVDFSLQVAPGEVHVLLGHSGSGKTTLLRAIAGFERLVAGSVALAGETVDDARRFVPPEHRRIGLVFQDYALFPHMSIARNVAFGMNARDDHAARELLGIVGLAHRAEARPSELSGGEQQRVALARALATRPRLLLLDEPFSNLDPELRAALRDETMRIVRQSGVAAVLVTHSAEEAMSVGDRISVLQRGRRVETARPRDLYFAPRTLVGARSVGPLSLVSAQALGGGRIRCALGELSAVHAPDEPGAVGQIAIRPGAIDVSAGNAASASVRARVDGCRYNGESFELALRLADGALLEARCPAWGAGVELSSEVGVSVREDAAIWIPDATP